MSRANRNIPTNRSANFDLSNGGAIVICPHFWAACFFFLGHGCHHFYRM
jgi:hypothetical protein